MNPIIYAVKRIRQDIPVDILTLAFRQSTPTGYAINTSTDSVIREVVINDMVLTDCNLVGGAQVVIPLAGCPYERIEPGVYVYTIPKERTQNRSILSALSVTYNNALSGYVNRSYNPTDEVHSALKQQMASISSVEAVSDARCSVIGNNVVMIEHADSYTGSLHLRCMIENDANMNHLSPRSWNNFATLCVYACKSIIYNKLIVALDRGYMEGGSEISVIRNIVEGYSDAGQTYRDYLTTTWMKTAAMNDPETRDRLMRITAGAGY